MQSLTAPIITHLKTNNPPWHDVEGLLQLSELGDKAPRRMPKLYVVELNEVASPVVAGSGPYLQSVKVQIGVMIVADSRNGKHTDLTPLRQQVRQMLFGFIPYAGAEPLALVGGSLRQLGNSHVAWLDSFVTEYTEDANHLT